MDLTCFSCKKTWDVSQAHILGAKLKFGLGFKEHTFVCPNCDSKNVITRDVFEAELKEAENPAPPAPKPVAAAPTAPKPQPIPQPQAPTPKPQDAPAAHPPVGSTVNKPPLATPDGKPPITAPRQVFGVSAPATPVVGAGPTITKEKHGTVVVRSLRIRKDHSTSSETVDGLAYGNKVTIISTWADGDDTWAQLGPDRWAAILYKGEAMIELTD
jgi:hypothetical protein